MMNAKEITIPYNVWASVLIALEQCVEHMAEGTSLDSAQQVRMREYAQRALRAARPEKVTH